jgi:tetratricopeptide (TPR) repeat protein
VNDATRAEAYAREAVELAQKEGMENLVALGYVDLGNTYFARGQYTEAEKYLKQGLEFAQRYNAPRRAAKALINLGSLRIQQGDTEAGIRYVEQARAFYQSGGYRKEESQALAMLGRAKRKKGDYAEAVDAFKQLLQLAERAGDPSLIALAHTELGNVLLQQDKYLEALQRFEESYKIDKSLGNELTISYGLNNRGDALWPLGRYDEASTLFEQAAAIAGKSNGKNNDLLAYIDLALANMALSQRRLAEAKAKTAQSLAASGGQNKAIAVDAKRVLGLAQTFSGAKPTGKISCSEALEMAKRMGDPWLISNTLLALAEAQLENGDATGALASAQEAQAMFARAGRQVSEWHAWLVAARASQRAGNLEAARDYSSRSMNLLAELQQKWGAEVFNTYQARPDVQLYRKQLDELSVNVR